MSNQTDSYWDVPEGQIPNPKAFTVNPLFGTPLVQTIKPKPKPKAQYVNPFRVPIDMRGEPETLRSIITQSKVKPFNNFSLITKKKPVAKTDKPSLNPIDIASIDAVETAKLNALKNKAVDEEAVNAVEPNANTMLLLKTMQDRMKLLEKFQNTQKNVEQRRQPLGYWNWGKASPAINSLIPAFQFMYDKPERGFSMPSGVRFRPDWLRKGVANDAQDQAIERSEREGARNEATNIIRRKEVLPMQWANELSLAPLRALNSGFRMNSDNGYVYKINKEIKELESSVMKMRKMMDATTDPEQAQMLKKQIDFMTKRLGKLNSEKWQMNTDIIGGGEPEQQDEPNKGKFIPWLNKLVTGGTE